MPESTPEESFKSCCALALHSKLRVELQLLTCAIYKGEIIHVGLDFLMLATNGGDVVIPLRHIVTQRILPNNT